MYSSTNNLIFVKPSVLRSLKTVVNICRKVGLFGKTSFDSSGNMEERVLLADKLETINFRYL